MRNPNNLTAEEAIRCFLDGEFTMGEESTLAEAVQKGLLLPLKNEEVEEILSDCLDENLSVEECKQRLVASAERKS